MGALQKRSGGSGMSGWAMKSAQRVLSMLFLVITLLLVPVARAGAQVLPAAAGAVGGFLAGTLVTTGTVVLQARMGRYVYGLDDLVSFRPEIFPIIIGPVTGIVIGATSPETLRRTGRGALIGAGGGAIVGTGVGQLLWNTSEGRWAGGIIGAAAGMVAGAVIYGVNKPERNAETTIPLASISLRVPSIGSRGGND